MCRIHQFVEMVKIVLQLVHELHNLNLTFSTWLTSSYFGNDSICKKDSKNDNDNTNGYLLLNYYYYY